MDVTHELDRRPARKMILRKEGGGEGKEAVGGHKTGEEGAGMGRNLREK